MKTVIAAFVLIAASASLAGDDSDRLLTIDHFVRITSKVPATQGQPAMLYVRERVKAGTVARGAGLSDRVVLFVHGAGTPAEVAFDVPYQDYSWMAYLANAGFDVFSVDMSGYGRSTRPAPMNDPCNVSAERQKAVLIPSMLAAPCAPTHSRQMTTLGSDWEDIDAAVDYVRALRRVARVSLVGWSQGGPRTGVYAARHPDKVSRIVVLAPAYNRAAAAEPPAQVPANGPAVDIQARADFDANWERQIECSTQVDPAIRNVVWSEMLASDPVGATWGPGVRRAPTVTSWGWTPAVAAKTQTPVLMVAAVHDKQVSPDRVRELYADHGAKQKVLVDLGCASHNAMWERNRLLMFRASLEWLGKGTVNGLSEGVVKMGYDEPQRRGATGTD
jgi:pimeloyl-ACP methyl ester carboxylesterase